MATALRRRFSYHKRLFLLLLTFSWALVACFVLFQYGREKHFKAERLDAQLQLFNLKLLDALEEGATPEEFAARHRGPFGDLRVTLISPDGKVIFDNSLDTLPTANHLDRPEVVQALKTGTASPSAATQPAPTATTSTRPWSATAGSPVPPCPTPCR